MQTVILAGVVGFVLGFFVSTWYRRHQKPSKKERAEKLSLADAAAPQAAD